jgi:DnaJ-class molecular chaperone
MGKDYYAILSQGRDATDEAIKNGYRKAAMKWHPQKNPNQKELAEHQFREIAEAFDVLIDPDKRAKYDQYGEEGLKSGIMEVRGEHRGYQYVGDPFALFQDFFGSTSPFAEVSEASAESMGLGDRGFQKKTEQGLEMALVCSLEDLYDGASKKVSVQRTRIRPDGRTSYEDQKLFTVVIKKGWKTGTKLTFKGEGNQTHPKVPPGDLVLVVAETEHPVFVRQNEHLVYNHKVTLREALTGHIVNIATLDKKVLSINVPEIANPSYEKRLPGRGMPRGAGDDRGDLIIRWDIQFPKALSVEEKDSIKSILGSY